MIALLDLAPDWVSFIAQDANGAWWGYSVEPLQNDTGWYENEIGQHIKLGNEACNKDWKNTLRKTP